jgi:cell wall-associated NlpC family hydrolase
MGKPACCVLVAAACLVAACGGRRAVPQPFPGSGSPPAGRSEVSSRTLPAVAATALSLLGVPYRNGGADTDGFDCSGFVQYVFARHGLALPREVRDQFGAGQAIDVKDVVPGDLVFFETVARGASHVGIALGNGEFVHAPSSRGVVRVERYTAAYWAARWIGARRV